MIVVDIACAVFACTAANHLGLVSAIGELLGHEIPIISCSKCFSCWVTCAVCLSKRVSVVETAAISLLAAYAAVWLELGMGYIDKKYDKCYDTIYSTAEDDTTAADADKGDTSGEVSDM